MALYELLFEISEPQESSLEAAEAEVDLLYAQHGRVHRLAVWTEHESAISAARAAVRLLEQAGVTVIRLMEDLVTRQDIADRVGATRQAVGNWIRGDRRGSDFPLPYHNVSGGIWLWGEVNAWCKSAGMGSDEAHYPERREYAAVNSWILNNSRDIPDISFRTTWHSPMPSATASEFKMNRELTKEDGRWRATVRPERLAV